MGIGGKTAALGQLGAEMVQMPFVQAVFQKRARIVAGRGVALKINQVRQPSILAPAEEMVVGHFIKRRHRSVAGDMAAHPGVAVIGVDHHGHGVPARQALDAALNLPVAGISRLLFQRDGIDIRRADGLGDIQPAGAETIRQTGQQRGGFFAPLRVEHDRDHFFQRREPIARRGRRRRGWVFDRVFRLYRFHVRLFKTQRLKFTSGTEFPRTKTSVRQNAPGDK